MRTRYTCPTLMHISRYIYAWKLRKECRVFWKVDDAEPDRPAIKSLVAQPLSIPEGGRGGWVLGPIFPNWATRLEMWIRKTYLTIYCHFRYPIQTLKNYQYRFKVRKYWKVYERKRK